MNQPVNVLAPGLADPGHDAQRLFRAVLDAFAHPGRITSLPDPPAGPGAVSPATAAYLLTLVDRDTPLWLAPEFDVPARPRLRALPYRRADRGRSRRGGLRRAGARRRCIARRLRHRHRPLSRPLGHPGDRGAGARAGTARRWRGPGIAGEIAVAVGGLGADFWQEWAANHALFPCGVDIVFTAGIATFGAAAQHRRGGLIMYVAVKGGETAIAHSLDLLADKRRGDRDVAELSLEQIDQQLALAVDRVMTEGSCYDRAAGGARHQAGARRPDRGDLPAARLSHDACRASATACRSTPRHGRRAAHLVDLQGRTGRPGAGPDLRLHPSPARLLAGRRRRAAGRRRPRRSTAHTTLPRVGDILERDGHARAAAARTTTAGQDLTRQPLTLPAARPVRLQNLARGDEGFLLALGYSTQRGYGNNHPFVGEIRFGSVRCLLRARGAGLRHRDRRDRRHRMRHGQPVRGLARRAAAVHPRLWPGLRPRRAQGDGHGAGRPRAARRGAVGKRRPRRHRTRSSCWRIPTMSRPRASCSTSSCRTMSTSSPSWCRCGRCAPKSKQRNQQAALDQAAE